MTIDKTEQLADVIVTLDANVSNGVYHLFFVHQSDNEVVHFQFAEADNTSQNKQRYAHFKVDTSKFKLGGNYKLYIYSKEVVNV